MAIHDFIYEYIQENTKINSILLDFGCGAGAIVERLVDNGYLAYGCDLNPEHSKNSRKVDGVPIVKHMEDGLIAFDDESIDFIFSNQVLEHVIDLEHVLDEMERVLKKDGQALLIFPSKDIWYEGHMGVPLIHKVHRLKGLCFPYALTMRSIGFGNVKNNKTRAEWAKYACGWLDTNVYYRSENNIKRKISKRFRGIRDIEEIWFNWHFSKMPLVRYMPNFLKKFLSKKIVSSMLLVTK